jgi:hypothetical protein
MSTERKNTDTVQALATMRLTQSLPDLFQETLFITDSRRPRFLSSPIPPVVMSYTKSHSPPSIPTLSYQIMDFSTDSLSNTLSITSTSSIAYSTEHEDQSPRKKQRVDTPDSSPMQCE